MKPLILILSIAIGSCHGSPEKWAPVFTEDQDSVVKMFVNSKDSTINILIDTSKKVECQAEKREIDSLKTELFLSQFAVTRVRYYLNICLKNPKQDKFLKGWIKRAIQ